MKSLSWDVILQWRRYSSYKLDQGMIVPAPGAELESFDPWQDYREVGERGRQRAPYLDLQAIASAPKRALHRRTLAFACRWGLLGLLPHAVIDVQFPLLWYPEQPAKHAAPAQESGWRLRQAWLRWTNEGWSTTQETGGANPVTVEPAEVEGRPVLFYEPGTDEWRSSTRLVLRRIDDARIEVVPFGKDWTRYFGLPGGSSSALEYRYPAPNSEEFWRIYREPMNEFQHAALAFNSALSDLARGNMSAVNHFLQPASVSAYMDGEGNTVHVHSAPSLLSAFALMAVRDFTEADYIAFCDTCGTPFASAEATPHCSPECRNASRKRLFSFRKLAAGESA